MGARTDRWGRPLTRAAQGATQAREFSRTRGFKFTRHAEAMRSREDQGLSTQAWGPGGTPNLKGTGIRGQGQVDIDRVNWKGIVYYQQECGMYDERPRLRKKGR